MSLLHSEEHHAAKQQIREEQIAAISVKNGARILDIGCGPGLYFDFWLRHTCHQNASFTLVDNSAEALLECRKIAAACHLENKVELINQDMFTLSARLLGKFDTIFIGNTLEYIPNPERYLKSIVVPLLNEGGQLVVRELDCGILGCNLVDPALCQRVVLSRILGCQMISSNLETYHDPFMGRRLGIILRAAGLGDVRLVPYYCTFNGPSSHHVSEYLSKLHTTWYLEDRPKILSPLELDLWHAYFDVNSTDCILERADFFYVETEFTAMGVKI